MAKNFYRVAISSYIHPLTGLVPNAEVQRLEMPDLEIFQTGYIYVDNIAVPVTAGDNGPDVAAAMALAFDDSNKWIVSAVDDVAIFTSQKNQDYPEIVIDWNDRHYDPITKLYGATGALENTTRGAANRTMALFNSLCRYPDTVILDSQYGVPLAKEPKITKADGAEEDNNGVKSNLLTFTGVVKAAESSTDFAKIMNLHGQRKHIYFMETSKSNWARYGTMLISCDPDSKGNARDIITITATEDYDENLLEDVRIGF